MISLKSESSALQVVVAIIVLLIIALSLVAVSTGSVSDLGNKVKSVISSIFSSDDTNGSGGIDDIIEKASQSYG